MCCPCLPIIAPTAKAGMNRWTVSDSGCCCGEEGKMQWMFLNITNQTDRKMGMEQACMEMRGKSYFPLWCLSIKVWLFLGITKSTEHENQFEPKEDSFILYKILTILMLRTLKTIEVLLLCEAFTLTCRCLDTLPHARPCRQGYYKQRGYSLSRQTLSSFLVIFLTLDFAESSTKILRVTYMLQFPLCGSDLEW